MYLLLNSLGVKCRFLTKKKEKRKKHESFWGHHLVLVFSPDHPHTLTCLSMANSGL